MPKKCFAKLGKLGYTVGAAQQVSQIKQHLPRHESIGGVCDVSNCQTIVPQLKL